MLGQGFFELCEVTANRGVVRLLTHREQLRADRRPQVTRGGTAVRERVEITRGVERVLERPLRIADSLADVALRVGDEPGVFVVAVGVVGQRLDLLVDLLERTGDPRLGLGTALCRASGEVVAGDQRVDVLAVGPQRLLEQPAFLGGIAADGLRTGAKKSIRDRIARGYRSSRIRI